MTTSEKALEKNENNINLVNGSTVKLKRELGLFSAVNLILGVMIGSGIFVSPASALKHSGSVAVCLIIWIISGVISLLGALSFAELGTVLGQSGAEYAYFREAFGKMHKFWGPLPSFICAWIYVVILRPAEVAIIVMTFAAYAIQPFTSNLDADYKDLTIKLTSISALFIMTYINITSVKLFVKVQNVFGICKVFACLIVIGGGIYEMAKGNTANIEKGFEGENISAGGIALALYSGLWAYDGWNSVTVVTEEIINPGVNVPLSISIAVPLITALYVFMNVAYMSVLSFSEMTSVPAVAVVFGDRVLGPASFLIPLGVAIATFGCAMSVQFGVSRVCYSAARGGHMLEVFSFVNMKRLTPAPAVALQALLTCIFIVVGNISTLIEFASWFLWFFYGLAMVALLVLRKTQAARPRPYRVPTVVPCFVLLVSIFLSVLPIVHDPSIKYLMAIGFIVIGVAVYTLFVYYKKTPKYLLEKFTFLMQVLFQSVPSSDRQD
ncbi:b(0,+)-type amino acid transporter 1-like isoform X1 [Leptidea sinapis]|uniref:b(0,+)-type amino acid transporter 1-like isoform X1 n=3 Tax=Leptidea sinapis TaxID=189913 RepID=UPI0021C2E29C|nr:b(0,+)-type amino acid transporter 1-like isoform X1 [Leptidea sinapis]XP_050665637.1 b(0,+)-type amino acid transporter 1-like isoform X1 [Leptidea sinapis]XP_050665638.1 b(0,+)-type amino acid transporter 1-like isoform X1 [Leptidea sinapis]